MSAGYQRTIDLLGSRVGFRHLHHHEGPRMGRHRGPFGPRAGMPFRDGMPPFGRGRPARRGEVRAAILALLAEQPMHGYQVITELTERSEGEWRPSAGSVYPTLQQLADEGLVRDREVDGRRIYELTEEGRAAVERSKSEAAPWERPGRDDMRDLRHAAQGVMSATMQIARDGDAAMHADARRILTEARRSLYRLLAEDGTVPREDAEGATAEA
jgi:DNA-binding PadR family transcriptional regulator